MPSLLLTNLSTLNKGGKALYNWGIIWSKFYSDGVEDF